MNLIGIIILALVICSFIGFPIWIGVAIHIVNKDKDKELNEKFQVAIPGFTSRMNSSPFEPSVVARALVRISEEWNKIHSDEDSLKLTSEVLNNLFYEFIPGVERNGADKYFQDSLGRWVQGVFESGIIRAGYMMGNNLGDTGFIHEVFHALQAGKLVYDPDHKDTQVWQSIVPMLRSEFGRGATQ